MALLGVLRSVIGSQKPAALSDEYIDSLMVSHTKYRSALTESEYTFTRALIQALKSSGVSLPLFYELKGSTVRYKLMGYQLCQLTNIDGEHGQIQTFITDTKIKHYNLQGLQDALGYIPEIVKYGLKLNKFHFS